MKKILLFSHEYPPCLGGVGTIALSIVNYFNDKDGYTIKVITSSRSKPLDNNIIHSSKFSARLWFLSYYFEFKHLINDADYIICNDPAAIYTAGKCFSKQELAKTICLIHGEEKYLDNTSLFGRLINFPQVFSRALYNFSNVVFVSDYIRLLYRKKYQIDIPDTNDIVINPGVLNNNNTVIRSRTDVVRFVSVSRLQEKKGFVHMLNVFKELHQRGVIFKWTIIGDGAFFSEFKALVNLSPISEYVEFLGAIPRAELSQYISNNDYCILLSELNESYGLSYLEGASYGLKSIGYNRCGVKEAFLHLENGLLVSEFKDINRNTTQIINFLNNSKKLTGRCLRSSNDFVTNLDSLVKEYFRAK